MSAADLQRRVDKLELDLARLRHQVPVRLGIPDVRPQSIVIIGGQSFGVVDGVETFGILLSTASGIPNGTYDPGQVNPTTGAETVAPTPSMSAWPDGMGYGTLWTGSEYIRVIVINDFRGMAATALIGCGDDNPTCVPTGREETILSQRTVTVAKLDTTLVIGYSPDLA